MKIENRPINKIKPYKQNAKIHLPEQIAKIKQSIEQFGWDVPIVIDKKGEIIKGHGRYFAAKEAGLKEIPCIVRTDLTPAQVRASRIADNRVAESEWDEEMLMKELAIITEFTGFDPIDVERIEKIMVREHTRAMKAVEDNAKEIDLEPQHRCPKCNYAW